MISIDVFDTAIYRDVYEPKDIFKLIEQKIGRSFAANRIVAENKAALNKFYTINDIYKYLIGFNPQIEIDMELSHVYANPEILKMYNENPSQYVFISDMYLSSNIIKQILEKCGYKNPKVFVSCEEKCNKGSGLLFKKVEEKIGKITKHYGDNYKSDIEGCIKQNIKPVFYPALHKRNLNLPAVRSCLLKKYAAILETNKEEPLIKLAKWYAPLIYEFTKWVIKQRKPGQNIYFLSRDMFMPYLIARGILKQKDISYLYCSRRSLAPLFLKSNNKLLLDKMRIVLTEEERQKKTNINDCLAYLKSSGIKNGDILVDIGYSGSTQKIIEQFLNIKLQGLYIQLDNENLIDKNMNMKMYLNRHVLAYRFLAEFIFTSPEDCIEDYKEGRVIVKQDNEIRKNYAKKINSVIVNEQLFNQIDKMNLSIFDVEQMLIHIQNYPNKQMMELFNEPILTNRTIMERGINFDRDKILNGELLDCYKKSYARPLFKRMLQEDSLLCGLINLLPE